MNLKVLCFSFLTGVSLLAVSLTPYIYQSAVPHFSYNSKGQEKLSLWYDNIKQRTSTERSDTNAVSSPELEGGGMSVTSDVQRRENVTGGVTDMLVTTEDVTASPLNSIDARSKWQQHQVQKFCSKYHLENTNFTLPQNGGDAFNLYRHLLFDDHNKLIFCFLPKVGCTHAKQLMFTLAGVLPSHAIKMKKVPNNLLDIGIKKSSFQTPSLSDRERLHKLTTYWKFTILRNPLERLVSAYRDKLSAPLKLRSPDYFDPTKHNILKKYHNDEVRTWEIETERSELILDFQTYIRWVIDSPNNRLNEHFAPMIHLVQPCRVQYDFFGNFKDLSSDMQLVMDKFDIPRDYYVDEGYYGSGPNTTSLLTEYYSTLSTDLKLALFRDFYTELDFYYHLFPEERDSHVKLLGVTETIV